MPRYRNTKERRIERREFIYKYRVEIAAHFKINSWGYYVTKSCFDWIEATARPELGYSVTTANGTIWRALAMEYLKMKEQNLIV